MNYSQSRFTCKYREKSLHREFNYDYGSQDDHLVLASSMLFEYILACWQNYCRQLLTHTWKSCVHGSYTFFVHAHGPKYSVFCVNKMLSRVSVMLRPNLKEMDCRCSVVTVVGTLSCAAAYATTLMCTCKFHKRYCH